MLHLPNPRGCPGHPSVALNMCILGNWMAHPSEGTACIHTGWVEVPTCRAQWYRRSSGMAVSLERMGHPTWQGRSRVYGGLDYPTVTARDQVGLCEWLKQHKAPTWRELTWGLQCCWLYQGAERCSSCAEIIQEVIWSQTQSHPSRPSYSLVNTLPRSCGNILLPFIFAAHNTNQVFITWSAETPKRHPCPAERNS